MAIVRIEYTVVQRGVNIRNDIFLARGDETDNEDIEDSDQEGEDYGYVVQLGRLLHVVLHLDVQRPLSNEAKTDKDLIIIRLTIISTSVVIHTAVSYIIT